jgi:predicted GNAT superfamily acetyltransferase
MDLQGIDIRPLATHDDLRAAEEVQRHTWGMPDLEIVPMHMLVAFILHGGVSMGAWDGDRQVGFVVGYPGFFEDPDDPRCVDLGSRHFHASQMMGVLPAYQNRGIGYALKLAQRQAVLAQDFRLVLWTFDPLLSRNAYFNISGLGCVVRRYIWNLYDEMTGINAGMPSDRFEVEWWLDNDRVEDAVAGKAKTRTPTQWRDAGLPVANPTTAQSKFRAPPDESRFLGEPRLLVEIPGDIDAIKAADMGLAKAWRFHMRALMDDAFELGYAVTGFATEGQGADRRSYYVVEKEFKIR